MVGYDLREGRRNMDDARTFGLLLVGGWMALSILFTVGWALLCHAYRQRFPR